MLVKRCTVMNREPDRRLVRIGPRHAVSCTWWDIKIVTALECDGIDVLRKDKHRSALKNNNPFAVFLVEPKSRRACLPVRDDPLDQQRSGGPKCGELFACLRGRNVGKDISGRDHEQSDASLVDKRFECPRRAA